MEKTNRFKLAQRALVERLGSRSLSVTLVHSAITATVLMGVQLHFAQAELVFESNAPTAVPTSTTDGTTVMTREAVREDRQNLRQVLNTSQKAEATNTATAQVIQSQPVTSTAVTTTTLVSPPLTSQVPTQQSQSFEAVSMKSSGVASEPHAEVQNLSKAELMRRERVREELRNEDLLQERLEELRLRDEKRRTDQMAGPAPLAGGAVAVSTAASTTASNETPLPPVPVVAEERVGSMATAPQAAAGNRPVVMAQNTPYGATNGAAVMQAQSMQPMPIDQLGTGQSSTTFVNANTVTADHQNAVNPEDKTAFWITPKFGVSNMSDTDGLNVQGRYTAGVGFGVGVSENLSFDLGYQFSEFGVGLSSSNPYQAYQPYGYNANNQNRSYKQNVVDAGIKLHFLGPQAKVRPFVGGGGAWSKSFLNYDEAIVKAYNQMGLGNLAQDYEVSSFLGYLSTGLDIKLSKSVSLGATFKYYRILSSHENQNLSYYGLSSYGVNPNSDNATVGGSLAKENFYSILAGVSFQF